MTSNEKYDQIVKLLKEGRTNREICKIARCSPNEITPIRKTINGENTDTSTDMKGKSICAQVFDLLEKGVPLAQIVIKVDIDPEEAMRLQDKYLQVLERDKIVNLLKNQKDLDLILEIFEFLQANSDHVYKIKGVIDLQMYKSDLMCDIDDMEENIKSNNTILEHLHKQIIQKQKVLGLLDKQIIQKQKVLGLEHDYLS